MSTFNWLNTENARYYTVKIIDGTSITINYTWGGLATNRSSSKTFHVQDEKELKATLNNLAKRRKAHGYELLMPMH